MSTHSKRGLSLAAAVFINLNIMVGGGIFVNTVTLARTAGPWGALTYACVGIILLPLVISFALLSKRFSTGSLYRYGSMVHPMVGFMSLWSYSMTKLASCGVAASVSVSLLQSLFPALAGFSTTWLAIALISIFVVLNSFPIKTGARIQALFLLGKSLAICAVFAAAFFLFQPSLFRLEQLHLPSIAVGIPFVLYAFMGFEAICLMLHALQNPERDGFRAIIIAYCAGVCITTIFQCCFAGSVPQLGSLSSYLEAYPALISLLGFSPNVYALLVRVVHCCIAISAAGVAFGIIATNVWNFVSLAEHNLLPGVQWLLVRNRYGAPVRCLLVQLCIVCGALLSSGNSIPVLQQLAAVGVTASYLCSVIALWYAPTSRSERMWGLLGIVSCCVLLAASYYTALERGILPLVLFGCIVGVGVVIRLVHRGASCSEHESRCTR